MPYPAANQPVSFKVRTAGNLPFSNTAWADIGDAALDIVLPAAAGDVIEVGINASWNSEAVVGRLDVASIVAGAPVGFWSGGTGANAETGIVAWAGYASRIMNVGPPAMRAVTSGDLTGGTVTLRIRRRVDSNVVKNLYAAPTTPLQWYARNIGPLAA